MEPLVAESVVLSASGEPVRPERKSSPTSPRPLSDDEGTSFYIINHLVGVIFSLLLLWIDIEWWWSILFLFHFFHYYYLFSSFPV